MLTDLDLDDDLVAQALRLTGTTDVTALVREALTALVEREKSHRLARLVGTTPDLRNEPRSRETP